MKLVGARRTASCSSSPSPSLRDPQSAFPLLLAPRSPQLGSGLCAEGLGRGQRDSARVWGRRHLGGLRSGKPLDQLRAASAGLCVPSTAGVWERRLSGFLISLHKVEGELCPPKGLIRGAYLFARKLK